MTFEVKKAVREKIYVKVALMAPSGGGKTYGALRLSKGMAEEIQKETGKAPKILMANTEAKRGYYYANEFNYDIVDITPPHEPEKYVELIDFAVKSGYDILIIDSSSHEWEGKGGCLELHQRAGGQYQHWSKITPRHNKFINAIADSPIHIIATMRGKDQY
ncbi:MAG: ATP-binding protein, partial [Lachnospiraceae bacterium]|nr:ATP-binding protein [Lachnospiraceae bacterium]